MNNMLNKRVSILMIVVTIFFILFEFVMLEDYFYNVKNNDRRNLEYYEGQYNTIITSYEKLATVYYNDVIAADHILDLMESANSNDEAVRKLARDEMIEILTPIYESMKKDNFRQLHFVLPDNTSFLRMHKPEVYGDDLTDIRETVRLVNENMKYIQGFEEGRIYNGYRYEFPLFNRNKYIGCVEASISFLSVIQAMDDLFKTPSFFMMRKTLVDDKVLQSEINSNYVQSQISSNYYYDKETLEYIANQEKYDKYIKEALKDKQRIAEISLKLEDFESFVVHSQFESKYYSVVFLEINNVIDKHAGYLVFLNIDDTYSVLRRGIYFRTFLIALFYITIMLVLVLFKKYKYQIERLSYYDTLTGAYNRNKLYDVVNEAIEQYNRYGTEFSLILFDIDKFKLINDNFGHLNGDNVLKELSDIVFENIRVTDSLFRFGGDEFIVLLSHTSIDKALIVAEKLRERIDENKTFIGFISDVTISASVVTYNSGETLEDVLEKADVLLYRAKDNGRNRVEYI